MPVDPLCRPKRVLALMPVLLLTACGGGDEPATTASATNRPQTQAAVTDSQDTALSNAVVNGSFETPVLPAGTWVGNPTNVGGWTFEPSAPYAGVAALTTTESAFTKKAAASGAGTQMVALQGLAKITQTMPVQPGDELWVRATQRANYNMDVGGFMVLFGSTYSKLVSVVTMEQTLYDSALAGVIPMQTGWNLYRFKAPATLAAGPVAVTLMASCCYRYGGDRTSLIDDVRLVRVAANPVPVTVPQGSFETPVLPAKGYAYSPTGSAWTFTPGAALAANGSAFFKSPFGGTALATTAGTQVAVLQGNAAISQVMQLAPGDTLKFKTQLRQPRLQMSTPLVGITMSLNVYVDGKLQHDAIKVLRSTGEMGRWTDETIALTGVLEAGAHTLEIRTTLPSPYPDFSVLIDDLSIERLQVSGT